MRKHLYLAAVEFNRQPNMANHAMFRYWSARRCGWTASEALYSAKNLAREVGIQTYADNAYGWDKDEARRIAHHYQRWATAVIKLP